MALNTVSALSTVMAFILGGRPAGAAVGLTVLATAPLLGVAPGMAWLRQRRLRRPVRQRR